MSILSKQSDILLTRVSRIYVKWIRLRSAGVWNSGDTIDLHCLPILADLHSIIWILAILAFQENVKG
jgi:hypothetical protein